MSFSEQQYRYDLLDCAKSLYSMSGVTSVFKGLSTCCSRTLTGFHVSIVAGSVLVRGRNHCHNRACCPVCSYPRQRRMMSDICHGIWNARHAGHGVYLVTLTFRHGAGDDMGVIQRLMADARQSMYRQGGFRGELRSMGYVGRVCDYEVQLMGVNGVHPHTHELLFADPALDLGEICELYDKYWITALYECGLSAKVGIACKVGGYQGVGNYITKMGSEVCLLNFTKESWGGGSMSPMRCLAMYAETGDGRFADAWLDYCFNIRGKRIIGFSRGLRDALGMHDFCDDCDDGGIYDGDLLVVYSDDARKLTMSDWCTVCSDIENGDLSGVLARLQSLRISYDVQADGLNKLNGLLSFRQGSFDEDLIKLVYNKKGDKNG